MIVILTLYIMGNVYIILFNAPAFSNKNLKKCSAYTPTFQISLLNNVYNFDIVDKTELLVNVKACYFIKFIISVNDTFCGIINFSAT